MYFVLFQYVSKFYSLSLIYYHELFFTYRLFCLFRMYTRCTSLVYTLYSQNNMCFINIHINIQMFNDTSLCYIKIKLANHPIYRYTTINREVVPMKQKFMWILFRLCHNKWLILTRNSV